MELDRAAQPLFQVRAAVRQARDIQFRQATGEYIDNRGDEAHRNKTADDPGRRLLPQVRLTETDRQKRHQRAHTEDIRADANQQKRANAR